MVPTTKSTSRLNAHTPSSTYNLDNAFRRKLSTKMASDIKNAKSKLRTEIKNIYSHVKPGDTMVLSESSTVCNRIMHSALYMNATRIGCYLSMPGAEIQTGNFVRHALSHGKRVFVPYLYKPTPSKTSDEAEAKPKRRIMELLELNGLQDYESLERDSWGIPTLKADSVADRWNAMGGKGTSDVQDADNEGAEHEERGLDLLVVPGVAFDEEGRRLGHGAGFYDRFLQQSGQEVAGKREHGVRIGVGLTGQMVGTGRIPMEDTDWAMDAVVVGNGRVFALGGTDV
ncbi:nagb/rpia/CoA transferase-like protein [Polychaeton citri CBS 116435]|uniref:5-formyltetrahydrofolate cyclo-ligase n=1 Tax=Polychaeton citri CBS 116435 TaxID=1314669 RepID=A0A9P4Q9W9_9PEZI|nr:nagb/rpia/CoA transferase-like protein [Polychaeton citri CBS 116435]